MMTKNYSLNDQINEKKDSLVSQIKKVKTFHIKKSGHSPIKLPPIKKIKYYRQDTQLTSLNNNNETTNSSNNVKTNVSNRLYIPVSKYSNQLIESKNEQSNRIFPLKIKIKSIKNLGLQKSSSADILIPKNGVAKFHKKLMEQNQLSCRRRLREGFRKFKNQIRDKEEINEMVQRRDTKKSKTGIYGPNNNIVSVLMARIQRLKLDNEYRGVDEDLKELIKDEILDAQVKLKMKPFSLKGKKGEKNPLFKTKLDKYRYLTKMNLIREINQNAITPLVVDDGNIMLKLVREAFDNYKINFKL